MGFFSVSAFILAVCLVLLLISFNKYYFQYYLNKKDKKDENTPTNSLTHLDNSKNKSEENILQGQNDKIVTINNNEIEKSNKNTQIIPNNKMKTIHKNLM